MTIFGVIFYPISQFLFNINSPKQLYLARTKDDNLLSLLKDNDCSKMEKKVKTYTDGSKVPYRYDSKMMSELDKHRMINLTGKDKILLFFHSILGGVICNRICLWTKRDKLVKLFKRSDLKI